jgi:hypothetical protein
MSFGQGTFGPDGKVSPLAQVMRSFWFSVPGAGKTRFDERDVANLQAHLEAAGYVIVPVQPTEEMIEAGMDYDERDAIVALGRAPTVEECQAGEYRAMIDARPK